MSEAANGAIEIGSPGMPVLHVDYNELRSEPDEPDLYAARGPWKLTLGQRVVVSDSDGLCGHATVCGPWLSAEFVGVSVFGDTWLDGAEDDRG